MARHYSTKDFFRQMPNALLARYFHERGLFETLDFSAMKEGKSDPLFAAWLCLSEEQRNAMDAEFGNIFEMSCEKGFRAIIDEARWQMQTDPETLTEFVETLSVMPNHYHRAMSTYLDHSKCWKGATRFYHADTLPYWRKRKNMGHRPAVVDDASIQQLARQIRNYFHRTEGRGNNCVVEPFRRGELDYFFCYPEDYSQQSIEWVNGEFNRRPHNPAFEVIYVYSQKEGTLDLNFHGSHKIIEPLQGMFATTILKLDELPPDPKDERVYDLNPLRQRGFSFIHAVGSGIESVTVKKLRFSSRVNKGDRITLEADTTQDPDGVYVPFDWDYADGKARQTITLTAASGLERYGEREQERPLPWIKTAREATAIGQRWLDWASRPLWTLTFQAGPELRELPPGAWIALTGSDSPVQGRAVVLDVDPGIGSGTVRVIAQAPAN